MLGATYLFVDETHQHFAHLIQRAVRDDANENLVDVSGHGYGDSNVASTRYERVNHFERTAVDDESGGRTNDRAKLHAGLRNR